MRKKVPLKMVFYISWFISFLLGSAWSFLMHIDLKLDGFLKIYFQRDVLYAVLGGYAVAILIALYFVLPYPENETESNKDNNKNKNKTK